MPPDGVAATSAPAAWGTPVPADAAAAAAAAAAATCELTYGFWELPRLELGSFPLTPLLPTVPWLS
ncbi:unnamed protein product [Ectocarpus sp. CCAP 1310/34]|nr:unnamed protein product [Ectocarpus sp. CCAP 1310/34]